MKFLKYVLMIISIFLVFGCSEEPDLKDFIMPNLNSRVELESYSIDENVDGYNSNNIRTLYGNLEFPEKLPSRSRFFSFEGDSSNVTVLFHTHNHPPREGLWFRFKEDSVLVKLGPNFNGSGGLEFRIPRNLSGDFEFSDNVDITVNDNDLRISSITESDSIFVWFTKQSGLDFIYSYTFSSGIKSYAKAK